MPHFAYEALNRSGSSAQGSIPAESEKAALAKLRAMELYPVRVYEVASAAAAERTKPAERRPGERRLSRFLGLRGRVGAKHLVPFLSDFASLIAAGIPIVRSLAITERQATSREMRAVIEAMRLDVEGGSTLTEGMRRHPRVFSVMSVNMVNSGEVGGVLDKVLTRLAYFLEKSAQLRAKVRAALTYPTLVLCFALGVVTFLVAFVIPKFFVIFEDFRAPMPAATLVLFNVSTFLRTRWYLLIAWGILLVAFLRFLNRIPSMRYRFDAWKLKLPVVGPLFAKVSVSRFARTFGTLSQSGVPILTTLAVVRDACGNLVYAKAVESVRGSVREGEGISGPLGAFDIFPPVVTNMVRVGEETGTLAEMLLRIADKYDEEIDLTLSVLTSLLEPILIMILGVVVGFIVIALFLPLVSLIESLSSV